jgi:hypothetical protein
LRSVAVELLVVVLRESLLLYAPSSWDKGERKRRFLRQSKAIKAEEKRERERKTRTCPTSSKLAHMLLIAGVAIVA